MKRSLFTPLFITLNFLYLSAQYKAVDSTHFNYTTPKVGNYITLRLVWGCTFGIRPDITQMLNEHVVAVINNFPDYIFQLEEHTDCRGNDDFNKEYTQRKANQLVAYIVSRGIDSLQIIAKGMGEDSLLIKKCNCGLADEKPKCLEIEHQLNRRTILRIVRRKED